MTKVVEVRTGARLHFGLFATTPGDGPLGGVGLMIDRPGFVLQACRSPRDRVEAPPEVSDRVADLLARVRIGLNQPSVRHQVDDPAASLTIRIVETIPPHRGFGSGTQLAYAVAAAVVGALGVWPPFTPDEQLGRGSRSAVGTAGFRCGGFLVDAGVRHGRVLEPGVTRRELPPEWRFVVIDPQGPPGPSGPAETAGFGSLPPMPRHMSQLLFEIVSNTILPALDARDFRRFAAGVANFNRLVGEHFAPVQGGAYAHPLIRDLSATLTHSYWPHLAQSSWGPAAAVFCENQESAEALQTFLGRQLPLDAAHVFIAVPRNTGAEVEFTES